MINSVAKATFFFAAGFTTAIVLLAKPLKDEIDKTVRVREWYESRLNFDFEEAHKKLIEEES